MPWYYVGPTWFSQSGGSPSPQGYLHVPVAPLSGTTCYNSSGVSNGQNAQLPRTAQPLTTRAVQTIPLLQQSYSLLNPNADNSAGYMSCTQIGTKQYLCPYIINATNTPTAGALRFGAQLFQRPVPECRGERMPVPSPRNVRKTI